MLHLVEILAAVADQHRAVEFRVAADIVVVAGVERRARRSRTRSPSAGNGRAGRSPAGRGSPAGRRDARRLRGSGCRRRSPASPAATVAPPMPEPMMTMSGCCHRRCLRRCAAGSAGSKNTALSRLKASCVVWPGCDAGIGAQPGHDLLAAETWSRRRCRSRPARPLRSGIRLRRRCAALRSAPSGSVSASGRMPKIDLLAGMGGKRRRAARRPAACSGSPFGRAPATTCRPLPLLLDRRREQVHGRRAHEVGDEHVGRIVVDLGRRAELLQHAVLQHGDLGGQRHRLDLVVGDVDDGRASSAGAGA